jgi:hypothetical protein
MRGIIGIVFLLFAVQAGAAERRYAAMALVGDRLEVVVPQRGTGASTDRNLREIRQDGAGTFDRLALAAVQRAIERAEPGAGVTLLQLPATEYHQNPHKLIGDTQVALPGPVLDALERAGTTHLFLLTKHRADMQVRTMQGNAGIGKVQGLGFYLDPWFEFAHSEGRSRAAEGATGFLAPFVYIRVSLVDIKAGNVVREQLLTQAELMPVTTGAKSSDPWDLASNQDKLRILQRMLDAAVERAVPQLMQSR